MERRTKRPFTRWRETRPLFTAAGAAGGFTATVLFALYNGGLGLRYASLWHGSISVYYFLLSLVRGILLAAERRTGGKEEQPAGSCRRGIFFATSAMMLVMNAALVTPVSLMVLDHRPARMGMIPAIASAAYTTYKVSAAAMGLRRAQGSILRRELRVIRLVDALMPLLVLRNTLIVAVEGGVPPRLFRLAAISSGSILLVIFIISVTWLVRGFLSF